MQNREINHEQLLEEMFALRQRVQELEAAESENEKLQAQLIQAQKMEAVGRLTAGIAHDFNNLLTAINGFAELMYDGMSPGDPRREMVDSIIDSGRKATNLVRQLMAFSRKQASRPGLVDLNDLVTRMEKMLHRIIGEHIQLETSLDSELWQAYIDPTHVEQIVVNLAVNARDAMPKGGRLIIETSNAVLDSEYCASHLGSRPGQYVRLAVIDTGEGINQNLIDRIFEPFFTTKELGQGTGLGLASVYGVVKQGEGYIWVESEEGQGSTFEVFLPRSQKIARPETHAQEARQDAPATETVLVVEDDPVVRKLTTQTLEMYGYSVLAASEGSEAHRLLTQHRSRIDILITDLVLPGASGTVVAAQLVGLRPELKVLFISGYSSEALNDHGIDVAETSYLQKPFAPQSLIQKIRTILDE